MHFEDVQYIYTVIFSINVLLHGLCMHLLIRVYRTRGASKTQQLYLLNLSFAELMHNLHHLIFTYVLHVHTIRTKVTISSCGVLKIMLFVAYMAAMFLLTFDRLAASILTVRYKSVCTPGRVKAAIISTWCLCITVIPVIYLTVYAFGGYKLLHRAMYEGEWLITAILNVAYFLFAVATYSAMFITYMQSKRKTSTSHKSAYTMFKQSRFRFAVLVMSSCLVLEVIPQIVFTISSFFGKTGQYIAPILFYASDTVDGIIYILLYRPVRTVLKHLIKRFTCKNRHQVMMAVVTDVQYRQNTVAVITTRL